MAEGRRTIIRSPLWFHGTASIYERANHEDGRRSSSESNPCVTKLSWGIPFPQQYLENWCMNEDARFNSNVVGDLAGARARRVGCTGFQTTGRCSVAVELEASSVLMRPPTPYPARRRRSKTQQRDKSTAPGVASASDSWVKVRIVTQEGGGVAAERVSLALQSEKPVQLSTRVWTADEMTGLAYFSSRQYITVQDTAFVCGGRKHQAGTGTLRRLERFRVDVCTSTLLDLHTHDMAPLPLPLARRYEYRPYVGISTLAGADVG
ncbi:hypothetical protein HYFRA_00011241 [Hymenoscyphus fraxineus]|uniref:Uncharacterized protein n=1 Tax=Hymenoscyphus fraxineus TaxID=746836 RepID=A0A9N9KWP4_9HELO|nr:hypothetical protein HYFRA_00011241 [Hymenoscyphus fraxineus]